MLSGIMKVFALLVWKEDSICWWKKASPTVFFFFKFWCTWIVVNANCSFWTKLNNSQLKSKTVTERGVVEHLCLKLCVASALHSCSSPGFAQRSVGGLTWTCICTTSGLLWRIWRGLTHGLLCCWVVANTSHYGQLDSKFSLEKQCMSTCIYDTKALFSIQSIQIKSHFLLCS